MQRNSHCIQLTLLRLSPGFFPWRVIDGRLLLPLLLLLLFPLLLLAVPMIIIPFNLCKNIIWKLDIYEADGHYIKDCINSNRDKHVYIDEDLCYYNFLK
jgi:hypothetical protein